MNADKYNMKRIEKRAIEPRDITLLTYHAQRALDVRVDGFCGPNTLDALRADAAHLTPQGRFRSILLGLAESELGRGETSANNQGPDIEKYATAVGMETPILWCAVFQSWLYLETCKQMQILPANVARANARRMGNAVLDAGGVEVNILDMRPGDLVVWARGLNPYHGHIGLVAEVESDMYYTYEGNKGRFPSKVRLYPHEYGEPGFLRVVRYKELV